MIRKAFFMKVYEGCHEEYEVRHREIWPDLQAALKSHGAYNYSIFLDSETSMLVGYVEVESEERWGAIAQTPACRRWWAYMKDIMETNEDHSPKSRELKHVFYLA